MSIWNNPKFRAILFQSLLIIFLLLLFGYLISNTIHNLEVRGMSTGFGFMQEKSGFDILFSLIHYDSDSSYGRTFVVGIINTILVASISIIITTIMGFLIGIARLSSNWLVAKLAMIYIEVFRNIPLLLQIMFWYSIILSLPEMRASINLWDIFYLNNRGFFIPQPIADKGFNLVLITLLLTVIFSIFSTKWNNKRQEQTGIRLPMFWINTAIIVILPLIVYLLNDQPLHLEYPVKQRFNFKGGMSIIPELTALVVALSIYTAAFIAEIVRSGILSVNKGQIEAANSLGLMPKKVLSLVVIPQAMRVIIPQLTSQYLNLTKNSSLATAIGYPDLVAVFAGTTLNQTGRAIETISMTMAVYLILSLLISLFMNWYNKRAQITER